MVSPQPTISKDADSDRIGLAVTAIETLDGSSLLPVRAGVTVIVGANNSGKSTFLRELHEAMTTMNHQAHIILKQIAMERQGSPEDLRAWLISKGAYTNDPYVGFRFPNNGTLQANLVEPLWASHGRPTPHDPLAQLAPFFVHYGNINSRSGGVNPCERRSDISEHAQSWMHKIEDDIALLKRVCNYSERIFGQTLTLDPLSGRVQFRVGRPSVAAPPIDAISPEYRKALTELPTLHTQGDGMTAVLGLLIPLVAGGFRTVIIDEPEAFLHPPQAQVVGSILGELAQEGSAQIFIATHDRNMLIGLLESGAPITVIRLDRKQSQPTNVHQLDQQRIRDIRENSVLRYSNVLDGLFYRAVILCEAERDCTFYSASLDVAAATRSIPFLPGDVLFVPAHGKDGFPGMAHALRALAVPVIAIPDFDLLNDTDKTRVLIEALGGDWSLLRNDYKISTQQFRQPRTSATNGQILAVVSAVLNHDPAAVYVSDTEQKVKVALRVDPSPWQALKLYGERAMKGQASPAVQRLLTQLQQTGIVLVRNGELEGLAPNVASSKGAGWLAEALASKAYAEDPAQAHIDRVVEAVGRLLLSG